MQLSDIVESFWRDGIVILPRFFQPAEIAGATEEMRAIVLRDPKRPLGGGPEYPRRRGVIAHSWYNENTPECAKVMRHPRMAEIAHAICGEDCVDGIFGIYSTPPYGGCQGSHQDTGSDEPQQFELNRIVFPLDVEPEQGELCYVVGSHKMGHLPHGGNHEPIEGEKHAAPAAGTLVLMHTRCWHRVSHNYTDQPRFQMNSRVRPQAAREDLCAYAVFRTGTWNFKTKSEW